MRTLLLATLLFPTAAMAEPRDRYVGATASLMLERTLMAGGGIEGGIPLVRGDLPLGGHWVLDGHGRVAAGGSEHGGSWDQLRAGVEGRLCFGRGWVCGFAGLDVGYQYDHAVQPEYDSHAVYQNDPFDVRSDDLIAVPRFGLGIGTPVRVQLDIEPIGFKPLHHSGAYGGLAVTGGIAFVF